MKYLIVILLSISSYSQAKSFVCRDKRVVANEIKYEVVFNSAQTSLRSNITILGSDGSVLSQKLTHFISPSRICKVDLNFISDCRALEKDSNLGYDYAFSCPKFNLSGNFYVDKTGFGKFQCQSPSTSDLLQTFDCVAQQ